MADFSNSIKKPTRDRWGETFLLLLVPLASGAAPPAPKPAAEPPARVDVPASPATPAPAPVSARKTVRSSRTGVSAGLSVGVSGCTHATCGETDPSAGIRVSGLYRFHRNFAVGLQCAFLFRDDESMYDLDVMWFLVIAAEARVLFPVKSWDIWIGAVLGYGRIMEERYGGNGFRAWANGFVGGVGLGAEYYFSKNLAAGMDLYLHAPYFREACLDTGSHVGCGDVDPDDVGFWWSLGLSVKMFFHM